MQKAQTHTPRRFGILLFDGFSNLCLANAVEPLRAANTLSRNRLYTWEFLSIRAGVVPSSSGLEVRADALRNHPGGDFLFAMPSYGHQSLADPPTLRALRASSARFRTLVGLDTGSWLLAAAGLLDGHRATSHWDILDDLAEHFPAVDVVRDRYVLDGARASCGGATTTLDLMLALIARDHGIALSLEVAALFMHGERPPDMDPARHLPPHRKLHAAAAVMRRHVEEPLPIRAIAAAVDMGERALEALFRTEAGLTPSRLYRSIRLAEGRRRMEQTRDSVAEVAGRCGYADAAAFTRAFRAEFDVTPSQSRRDTQ